MLFLIQWQRQRQRHQLRRRHSRVPAGAGEGQGSGRDSRRAPALRPKTSVPRGAARTLRSWAPRVARGRFPSDRFYTLCYLFLSF